MDGGLVGGSISAGAHSFGLRQLEEAKGVRVTARNWISRVCLLCVKTSLKISLKVIYVHR